MKNYLFLSVVQYVVFIRGIIYLSIAYTYENLV
jgi:hypothetical protein